MNGKPLLSICIPTRNRAAFLYRTLRSITEDPVFQNGNEIEIVVSDNASTDATKEIVQLFLKKYPDKIVYSRNEHDIADKNFEKSLRLGNGTFRKLNNDTFWFIPGGLKTILSAVRENRIEQPVLLFPNENKAADDVCKNLDDFVQNASFIVTWIGAFEIWQDDLEKITDFSEHVDRQLTQMEIVLNMAAQKEKSVIINKHWANYQTVWDKPGYVVEKVFGQYYLDILQDFVQTGKLSKHIFEQEKRDVLKKHILEYYFNKKIKYNRNNLFENLNKYYSDNLYFYIYCTKFFLNNIFVDLINWIKIKHRGVDGNFRKHWRKRNKLSSIAPVKIEYPNMVYVGNGSSGDLVVENANPETDVLIVGENVKIGKNVRFVFNGAGKLITVSDNFEIPEGTTVFPDSETGKLP